MTTSSDHHTSDSSIPAGVFVHRGADPTVISNVAALIAQEWGEESAAAFRAEATSLLQCAENVLIGVSHRSGEVRAAALITKDQINFEMWSLTWLIVDPQSRGRGLGVEIVQRAFAHVMESNQTQGASACVLQASSSTPEFFTSNRLGFHVAYTYSKERTVTYVLFKVLSSVAHQFAGESNISAEIVARLVWAGAAPSVIADGIQLTRLCFPTDPQAAIATEHAYHAAVSGRPIVKMIDRESSDFGLHIEGCAAFVYYIGHDPVGTGSLYRYCEKPDDFWLGRLSVDPKFQRQGIASQILTHIEGCIARLGGRSIRAFTEAGPENSAVHKFYEGRGFHRVPEKVVVNSRAQRVYLRTL